VQGENAQVILQSPRPEEHTRLLETTIQDVLNTSRSTFDALTEHEKSLVLQYLSEALLSEDSESDIHTLLWEMDFLRKPVSITEFLENDEYLGRSCSDLHPRWKEDLATVFAPGSQVFEWLLTGAIGIGKTTIACAALAYKIYYMSCMRDPASYYGLLRDSMIVFGLYSITKRQVNDSGYFKLRGFLDQSPYFRNVFPRNPRVDTRILFTKSNMQVLSGSTELHSIGLDLFAFCFSARTYVWTEEGPVLLKDLVETPRRVWTRSGNEFVLTAEPMRATLTGCKPVLPIRLSTGQTIEPTLDQPILVNRGLAEVWVEARNLLQGDIVLAMGDDPSMLSAYANLPDLSEADLLSNPTPANGPRYAGEGVQETVSAGPAVRQDAIENDQGRNNRVPGLSSNAGVPNAFAPAVAWTEREDICQKVSKRAADTSFPAETMGEKVTGARNNTEQNPCPQGGITPGYSQNACALRKGRSVQSQSDCSDHESGHEASQARSGWPDAEESPRTGACLPVSVAGPVVALRTKAGDSVCVKWKVAGLFPRLSTWFCVPGISPVLSTRCGTGCEVGRGAILGKNHLSCERERHKGLGTGTCATALLLHCCQAGIEQTPEEGCSEIHGKPASKHPGTRVAMVLEIGTPTEPEDVFDILNVPETHNFLVGLNPDLPPVVGKNCMDEVNFMRVKTQKETGVVTGQAYDLYKSTHSRLRSRFMRPGGNIPGLMLLLSSRNAQTSFLEEHLKQVGASPSTFISDYPIWEVKPAHKYVLPWFKVEVGDRVSRSRILHEGTTPRLGSRVVSVPGEFEELFKIDVEQGLREVAGIATFNISPLIRDRQSVLDAYRDNLSHPFTRDVVTCGIGDMDDRIDHYFKLPTVCCVQNSKWQPKLNPHAPRFIHVDIGLTGDGLGMAMGHVGGLTRHERTNADGTISTIESPFIVIDFILSVRPPEGGEIDLGKVRSFIIYLSRLFNLMRVTFDGFQSADCIQILNKSGIEAGKQSVDITEEPYLSLRSALFERRIVMYKYRIYEVEVLDLIRDIKTNKVDHPSKNSEGGKGSKDCTDGVAGVVFACINDKRAVTGALPITIDNLSKPASQGMDMAQVPTPSRVVAGTKLDWSALKANATS
jgi:hypothetical protein